MNLVTGEQKVGVMFVNYHDEHRFTGDEPETMALFANQAAVAIRHAQLYEQVQRHADTMETLAPVDLPSTTVSTPLTNNRTELR